MKDYEEKMSLTHAQLKEIVPTIIEVAKSSPEKIGHRVTGLANLIHPLADSCIGFASHMPGGSEKQTALLDTAKTVAGMTPLCNMTTHYYMTPFL